MTHTEAKPPPANDGSGPVALIDRQPFEIETGSAASGVAHVRLHGELDLATVDSVRERVLALAADDQRVVVDMTNLSFIDLSGIRVLLQLTADAARDGWTLGVVAGPRRIQRVIQLVGAEDRLPFLSPVPDPFG